MIATALRLLFPPACAVAVHGDGSELKQLPAVEAAVVEGATPQRRQEFAAGRAAARSALAELGCVGAAIGCGPGREPQWPGGFVGSIAHSERQAVAVAARTEAMQGLGVDLERDGGLQQDLWAQVLTPSEMQWLLRYPENTRAHWATVVFCAKEAYYKMQYPLTRQWVEFGWVEVEILPAPGQLMVHAGKAPRINSTRVFDFVGRFAVVGTFVLAGLYLPVTSRQLGDRDAK